jgi:hypothetical protein
MVSAERLRLGEADLFMGKVRPPIRSVSRWHAEHPYPIKIGGQEYYEYFHGDNGAGIGASHQTGWTGTVAPLPLLFRGISAEALRTGGRGAIKSAAAGRRTGAAR